MFIKSLAPYPSLQISNIQSLTRDIAASNGTFMKAFESKYLSATGDVFHNDIRCAAHVYNIAAKEILTVLAKFPEPQTNDKTLLERIRRIRTMTKSTETHKLLLFAIQSCKKGDTTFPSNFRKTVVPIGKAGFFLFFFS